MDRRAKLLGMDQMNVSVSLADSPSMAGHVKVALVGSEKSKNTIDVYSPEQDARRLIALMTSAGILPLQELDAIVSQSGVIVDAEILEETNSRGGASNE